MSVQYQYTCSNLRCTHIMVFATAQVKDINCSLCTHKTSVSNRNVSIVEVNPPPSVPEPSQPIVVDKPIIENPIAPTPEPRVTLE